MANLEITYDKNPENMCIPLGAAVSAKFRGAFCEAIVNAVDKKIYCRIQLDDKKTVKIKEEDITGSISVNNKVRVGLETGLVSGVILKVIDNSVYHVVFNDGDTGILRRNQLVLKGDRHYKLSECLDRHPLTNPEQFTKAVINEKRIKEKSDSVDEEEFENDEIKSCSQESMTTVSSSKTRSRQQTVASSASVGTGGSSVTAKTFDDVNKTPVNIIKSKKSVNTKYSIGSLVIASKVTQRLEEASGSDKIDKKNKPFVGLIVSSSIIGSDPSAIIKVTQCVVKSFRDNHCYVAYKKDLELVVKRDILIKYKDSDPSSSAYVEKSIVFFDVKILPNNWDFARLLQAPDPVLSGEGVGTDNEQTTAKLLSKSKPQSSRTSISSLDSCSHDNDDDNDNDNNDDNDNDDDVNDDDEESEPSNEDDQNAKDEWVARFYGFWEDKGSPINSALEIIETEVDIYRLYELVNDYGGFLKVTSNIRWPHLYHLMKLPQASSENYQKLQILYKRYIFPYVEMKRKLGTFEQIRNRRSGDKGAVVTVHKARPLLSARERRECQLSSKKATISTPNSATTITDGGACSVSSQSACEVVTKVITGGGDDVVVSGDPSVATSLHSHCSSTTANVVTIETTPTENTAPQNIDLGESTTQSNQPAIHAGTMVSVAYGDDKVYKAKIVRLQAPPLVSLSSSVIGDTASNADSTNSATINDMLDNGPGSTLYKVHYIGWNNRHDEIIASDRILEVLSDTGQHSDSNTRSSRSRCSLSSSSSVSSAKSRNLVAVSEPERSVPISESRLQDDDATVVNDGIVLTDVQVLVPDLFNDGTHDVDASNDSCHTIGKTQLEPETPVDEQCDRDTDKPVPVAPTTTSNLKRRRSRSACIVEPDHIIMKRLPTVPESPIIASLNLYKNGDKMPKRPIRRPIPRDATRTEANVCKTEEGHAVPESSSLKRHSSPVDDAVISPKISKIETVTADRHDNYEMKTERLRSPSFSNESLSDASTISFREVDDQHLFFIRHDNNGEDNRSKAPLKPVQVGNKRGRKPLKKTTPSITRKTNSKDNTKSDAAEVESNSSQHSGSAYGKRVTRSLRPVLDRTAADDASGHQLEEDSQTSQDGSMFPLPPSAPSDHKSTPMTPLATGTPTSAYRGRRPKSRRKNRNSQSNSSVECTYQDSNGETNNYTLNDTFTQPRISSTSPGIRSHNRPPGRTFQRLHPSLIPHDLQELMPEERVKLLESLIRQTHLNFLDTKDKLKYVEKRISEIKSSRANGHSIESDEEKFR